MSCGKAKDFHLVAERCAKAYAETYPKKSKEWLRAAAAFGALRAVFIEAYRYQRAYAPGRNLSPRDSCPFFECGQLLRSVRGIPSERKDACDDALGEAGLD